MSDNVDSSPPAHSHDTFESTPQTVTSTDSPPAAATEPAAAAATSPSDAVFSGEQGDSVPGPGVEGDGEGDAGRESRIANRKKRMEARRLAKMRPEKSEDSSKARRVKKTEVQEVDSSKSKTQVGSSKRRIESAKATSSDQVTWVRVSLTGREDTRRQEEARKSQLWSRKREDERKKTQGMAGDIQTAWDKVMQTSGGPYELNELLTTQKRACDSLISVKNKLIEEYVLELKGKDDEYVKELKRQAEEIDTLLRRMETHHRAFQTTLREELERIERAFIEERTDLIDSNVKEIDTLFTNRGRNEGKYMQERADRVEDHVVQLQALRVHDAEEYNLVKIKLETDVQVLEQQLQQMRATYQLNTEKLEYNYQVLKKRDEENGTILGTQKRKIGRLTDHLHNLKAKMSKQEKSFQSEYMGLTDDYKRITEQFKELQKKFRHFQIADGKKFREVWTMNDEIARELMRKLLQADQIIYEQQLGLPWTLSTSPEEVFRSVDPAFFHSSSPAAASAAAAALHGSRPTSGRLHSDATTGAGNVPGTANGPRLSIAAQLLSNINLAVAFNAHDQGHPAPSASSTKKMLDLLCVEVSFLVEEKLQKLLSPLHTSEQSLMRLDSIFKALGVESMDDIETLMTYFFKQSKSEDGSEEMELIGPNDVVPAVRRFLDDKKAGKSSGINPAAIGMVDDDVESIDSEVESEPEVEQNPATTRASRSQSLREYWHRMANVINDDQHRVWTAVHTAMSHYNAELVARYALTQEIDAIQRQNEELKGLLRQYMVARVNADLQVPPAKILMLQAGVQA
ncbi:sperm tail-domain-containing protein [Powellomyces hirtus]|nr:sperm tail-domain-containing protein [Powellomyces hirtus]